VIAFVYEFSPLAGRADGVLRPTGENRRLGDVERTRAVVEHWGNATAVHGWRSTLDHFDAITAPEPGKIVQLSDFQSTNSAVARPDLVTGPVFKTGGGR